MSRYIALLILVIPGALAVVGVKLMRDSVFDILQPLFPWLWLQLVIGLILFLAGVGFIGGWIFYRDRKRHYVADRFKRKM
ncbi:DUF2627 domain-containing protein [Pullulanibacillus sp. KACC 23026]|uniref:DUF2627 domain-containing protein n=1 Tax=Pullulanibacillus sp. KACC 23026 TaxID=3028315 RepID=UPI0023AF3E63|nr:DUF2627 domain-containing protein [Pullulanibacillus sp. KACC 23026]WEG14330.1 DUF2627 domain-containing protein [Pullulanibacillus sp. KACC 23026]